MCQIDFYLQLHRQPAKIEPLRIRHKIYAIPLTKVARRGCHIVASLRVNRCAGRQVAAGDDLVTNLEFFDLKGRNKGQESIDKYELKQIRKIIKGSG